MAQSGASGLDAAARLPHIVGGNRPTGGAAQFTAPPFMGETTGTPGDVCGGQRRGARPSAHRAAGRPPAYEFVLRLCSA